MDAGAFVWDRRVRYWRPFVWETECESDDGYVEWTACAVVRLPLVEGFVVAPRVESLILMQMRVTQCAGYEILHDHETVIARQLLERGRDGAHFGPMIRESLERTLIGVLRSLPALRWMEDDKRFARMDSILGLRATLFFHCHEGLRDGDFFFWRTLEELEPLYSAGVSVVDALQWVSNGRKQKRVRRLLFAAYVEAMERGCYDPMPDRIFSTRIGDRNYLERLIALPYRIKSRLFEDMEREDAERVVDFLLSRFGERGAVRFFESLSEGMLGARYIDDISWMLYQLESVPEILALYRGRSPDASAVHDELARLSAIRERESNPLPFRYASRHTGACGVWEGLEYRLPEYGVDLAEWGAKLGNCLAGYTERVRRRGCVVYGVYRKGALRYALEIRDGRIVQISGRFNRPAPEEDRKKIENWFYKNIKN
jgi:hypothetical protein